MSKFIFFASKSVNLLSKVIHANCEIDDQCEMVYRTKNFRNGFIMEPITMGPTATVKMVMEMKEEKGFSTVPITQNGCMGGKLLGVVTGRDIDMLEDTKVCVTEVMTPVEKLIVGYEPITLADAQAKLTEAKLG
jgi:IMP dehydrogenase